MAISKNKRRYSVTLTTASVDRFQGLCKQLGYPSTAMSNILDKSLDEVSDTFQMALEKGTITIEDLKRVSGQKIEQAEQAIEEERRKAIEPNRKKTPRCPSNAKS
jgi:hypothetical protein